MMLIIADRRPGLPRRADGSHVDVPVESGARERARSPRWTSPRKFRGFSRATCRTTRWAPTHPEYADDNKLPFEATLGGKETLYPEYAEKLQDRCEQAAPLTDGVGPQRCCRRGAEGPLHGEGSGAPVSPDLREHRATIEVLPVQGSVYMLAGAGSNVTVQVGPNALFVVDTNEAAMSDKILAAIKTISPLPIRYIVNTSADPDHVGGNERFAKSAGDTATNARRSGAAWVCLCKCGGEYGPVVVALGYAGAQPARPLRRRASPACRRCRGARPPAPIQHQVRHVDVDLRRLDR